MLSRNYRDFNDVHVYKYSVSVAFPQLFVVYEGIQEDAEKINFYCTRLSSLL